MKTMNERRKLYHGMNAEEIIIVMDDEELAMNVRRGGKLAKIELKKRQAIKNLHPVTESRDLDLGV